MWLREAATFVLKYFNEGFDVARVCGGRLLIKLHQDASRMGPAESHCCM